MMQEGKKAVLNSFLKVGSNYLNTNAKALRSLSMDIIFGADRDGASPVSTK